MDLEQRLNQLESQHDWYGLIAALEEGLAAATDNAQKASVHLRLGRALNSGFVQGVRALKHFQDAYKLNPALVEALVDARSIYWEIGKLNMVQKLLELQLKSTTDASVAASLTYQLGDVLYDQDQFERAQQSYARSFEFVASPELSELIADLSVTQDTWQERIAHLLRTAHADTSVSGKGRAFLRAARIARRFAEEEAESILTQAYSADYSNSATATLLENLLVQKQRTDVILQLQQSIVAACSQEQERVRALRHFGTRWALRHQNPEVAAHFFKDVLSRDPSQVAVFIYLRDQAGGNPQTVAELLSMVDDIARAAGAQSMVRSGLLTLAGLFAWKDVGDVSRARGYLGQVKLTYPDLPTVRAFEAEHGAMGAPVTTKAASAPVHHTPLADSGFSPQRPPSSAPPPPLSTPLAPVSVPTPISAGAPVPASAPAAMPAAARPASVRPEPAVASAGGGDPAKIAELRAQLKQQEDAKKFHDVVKTLVQLGDELGDYEEKLDTYLRAADLYVTKFANQAEAVRVYEKVIECDPTNAVALDYLRQMYEKRRDWEKLIALNVSLAKQVEPGPERSSLFKDVARLATERVKKPDVCIDLWNQVLESDPNDVEALGVLAQMYERSREFEKLATILERLAELSTDRAERINVLNKLGQIAGDRLSDDVRAVEAYRALLELVPDDRRAQEQLKKRYVSLGRWDDLEFFYAESGKWDEFIRILETNEAKTQDAPQRIGMLMKIAELWLTQKGKADRAARAYEKILTLDPNDLAAAERLIPLYSDANNFKGLAGVIEVKLQHVAEPFERKELLREVGRLYESKLNDKPSAFARLLAVFDLSPTEEDSQIDVERAAKVVGRWDALVGSYRIAIGNAESAGDSDGAAALRLRLGRILVEELHQVDEALAEYRKVYEIDPSNPVALGALESLYRQSGRWEDLLDVYSRKLELVEYGEDRKAVLYEIAKLHEEQVGNLNAAVETYESVLAEDPADSLALSALDRLFLRTQAWDRYAEVLKRRIELDVDERTLVDLKFRLAGVLLAQPEGEDEALANYREILYIEPEHEGTRKALEGLLTNPAVRAEAAGILEAIYDSREEWDKLISTLEILALTTDESARRVELLRKMALTAATRLGKLDRAVEAQSKALLEDPSQADTRIELEGYVEQSGALDKLANVYLEIAKSVSDASLARDYWLRLAAIHEQRGRVDQAATCYERVLEIDSSDTEALEAMDALYRGTEHWEELVGVYRRRIELVQDPEDSERLYAQMAQVYEEKLKRPSEAILAYREVLAIDPGSHQALAALDGLFTRQRMWAELAENLEIQLSLADSDEAQLALMLRLAALREREMGETEAAIEGYRQVLDRNAESAEALSALERLGSNSDYELQIAEILEPLYRDSGDYGKLIGVHEVQVRRADEPARKVELLQEVAGLYEDAANDANAAFDTMARALSIDSENEGTQQALDRLARVTGRLEDLAQVFERLAEGQEDPEHSSRLTIAAARVYENDVQNIEKAIELYRKVLVIDPMNLGAAEALQALFQATGRYPDMSLILQRKAEILELVDDQKAALYEAARIEEEVLEKRESAIGVYQKVLELDAEDLRSIDALIGLYLGLSRWEELLGVYSRKADLVLDPEDKKLIYYQVGAVYERELGDVSRAIDTYQKVLELDPDDLEALGRLDVLYQTAENWQELLSVLTHEAELSPDPAESVSFQYRIAEIYDKRLEDVERAVELYREILEVQNDHRPTLDALEAIKSGEKAPLAAASVLEPVYEAAGQWPNLISVLEVQVAYCEEPYAKSELLHRIAALYEESLGQHGLAFDTFARAVQVDSTNEQSLGSLERLASVTDRWSALASLYDAEVEKLAQEPERFVELGLRVAQVYELQLENLDSAIARYRRVLDVDMTNQTAMKALDRLFTQTERWSELVEVLAKESDLGETPDEILELKFRLGQVYQSRLGELDKAIDAYRDVIAAAPEHQETLQALEELFATEVKQVDVGSILEPLYQANGEWEKLMRVHEAQLRHTETPDERMQMYYRIAEDAEEHLMDPVTAFGVFVRAIKEQPLDERTGEEIERLAAMIDEGWKELANAYADVLGLEGVGSDVQATIGKRLARVYEEELADIQRAEETYLYVLTVVEREPEALANLDRIYSATEEWVKLAGVLEQRVPASTEDSERIELSVRLGQVYEEQLGQKPDAIRAYRKVFDELDPANAEVIHALGRIYAETEQWTALKTVYERELENAVGDVEEAEIRARLAKISADRLGNVEDAISGWKRVLDLRGEDAEALWALADLYQQQGQWAELTDVLERHFDIAESDDERVSILTRRARLFTEQLRRDDEALETWHRVLDIDYANATALREIAAIWRKRNDPRELVDALHALIERAGSVIESEEMVACYRELGRVYGTALEQPYESSEAWRHLLEVDPRDFEAMNELERIYRAEERWVDVIGVKMQRADALPSADEQIRELLEVTDLWRKEVGEYDRATTAYEAILRIEPTHSDAFDCLERLHTAGERWEALIELYLNRLETREVVSEKSDLLRRIARVFDEKLGDQNQAFDALVNAFAEDYGDDETVKFLERMAHATNRWGELLQTANAWLPETDSKQKIQLCLRVAKWYGQDLQHPEWAQPYYAQIMQLDPNNVQVLRQIAAIHRISAAWQKVGETLQRALDVVASNEDRKAILVDMGELLERNLSQTDAGINYYRQALGVDPLYLPALEALERIYDAQNDASQLVDILSSKVRALTDSESIAKHKLRMGQLFETSLRELEKAGQQYRDVLELDGTSLPAMRGLERVDEATQNWGDLVTVLERQLDVVETERDRVEVLLKLATVLEDQFFKLDQAAQRLEAVLEIDPTSERAYVALERCYRKLKQWLDLINTYERHVNEATSPATKIELFGYIAQVFADEVGDTDRAIDAYQNIVDLDENHIEALEALAKLYEKQGDAARSIDAMTRVAELSSDGKQRVEMYYRIGKALDEKLSDRAQAQERLEMAVDLDPTHLPSLAALRTIAFEEMDWEKAARYLDQEQANTPAARARAKLLVELG
ncbi:MAG TPA: tetratricopeptide repeat protein, partial [Polyangiaceae bacterium]|nr:tetratricopeptide repeat protein [Polyangiaceae bacterium]